MSTAGVADLKEVISAREKIRNFVKDRPWSYAFFFCFSGIILAYLPHISEYIQFIWNSKHFNHAIFVPFAAAFLVYSKSPDLSAQSQSCEKLGIIAFSVSGFFLLTSIHLENFGVWTFSLIIVVAASILIYGGGRLFQQLWTGWIFLLLMIPLPYSIDQKITVALQGIASHYSSLILDNFLNVKHILRGNTILLNDKEMFVEEACSGINSLFATAAVLFFVVLYTRRAWLHSLFLFLFGFVAVMAVNVFRITSLTYLHHINPKYGDFFGEGTPHTIFGLFIFALLLFLLVSADSFFYLIKDSVIRILPKSFSSKIAHALYLSEELDLDQETKKESRFSQLQNPSTGSSKAWWTGAVIFGSLAILQWIGPVRTIFASPPPFYGDVMGAQIPGVEDLSEVLPSSYGPFTLDDFQSNDEPNQKLSQANFSTIWRYKEPLSNLNSTVMLHRPYHGWHRLEVCYANTGWKLENLQQDHNLIDMPNAPKVDVTHITFELTQQTTNERFILAYTMFDYKNRVFLIPKGNYERYITDPGEFLRKFRSRMSEITTPYGNNQFSHNVAGIAVMMQIPPNQDAAETKKAAVSQLQDSVKRIVGPVVVK